MIHQFQLEQNSVAAAESQRYAPMKQLIGSRKSSQLYENNQNLCSEKVHPLYASASTKQGYQEKSKQGKVIAQNIYPEQIKTKMLKEGYAKELRKRVKWFKVILFTYFHYYNHFVMVKKCKIKNIGCGRMRHSRQNIFLLTLTDSASAVTLGDRDCREYPCHQK